MNENITPQFLELTTRRLLLRQLKDSDAPTLASLRSNETVNRYLDRPRQTSLPEASTFINQRNADIKNGKNLYWAISLKDQPELIGTLCLFDFSENGTMAELGYELSPTYQGHGYASEALKRLIAFCFENLGLNTLVANVHQDNVKSVGLLLKLGFVVELNKNEGANHIYYMLRV